MLDRKKLIAEILSRQASTEEKVAAMQQLFYEDLLANFPNILSQVDYNKWFDGFNLEYNRAIIQKIITDIGFILSENLKYFVSIGGDKKDLSVELSKIITDFGFTSDGKLIGGGYFSSILTDTSIKRDVQQYLLKQVENEKLSPLARKYLKKMIVGDKESAGIFQKFYSRTDQIGSTIFDAYQRADRVAQYNFAASMGLQAARYGGGLIAGSRPFCVERSDKIFLKSEIAAWQDLHFQGKPAGYNPFEDLGGYRCRHFFSWLMNSSAMASDDTLAEDSQGNLYRK